MLDIQFDTDDDYLRSMTTRVAGASAVRECSVSGGKYANESTCIKETLHHQEFSKSCFNTYLF